MPSKKVTCNYIGSEIFAGRKLLTLSINGKRYRYDAGVNEVEWLLKRFQYLKARGFDGKALNFIKKRCKVVKDD